jgi:hypothetical protein
MILGSEHRSARAKARGALAIVGALVLAAPAAHARPVDDATRDAARELAHRAEAASRSGDNQRAADLYRRAYALVPAPTLSIREARALAQIGKLVEAAEAYVRTVRTPLKSDSPAVFSQAVAQAKSELAALRPRIPQLTIVIQGVRTSRVVVKLDGHDVPRALIGVAAPVDPGAHELTATGPRGDHTEARVALEPAESRSVTLKLEPAPPGASPAATTSASATNASAPTRGRAQRTWGFVGLGVGVAGLGVGLVTGLMATSRHSSAERECPNNRCVAGSSGQSDVDAFRTLRTVSTVGYIAGAVSVAAGVTLLLTAPSSESEHGLAARIGPGTASIAGWF